MKQLHDLMQDILDNGKERSTRSGKVLSVFRRDFTHDMRTGMPFTMTKRLAFKSMMGELLWFLNGETDLTSLRKRSCLPEDSWTIWSNDCDRWNGVKGADECGNLYGHQWINFGETDYGCGVDQISNLINKMKNDPCSRYMLVQAYNPMEVQFDEMALPPCHTGFQVYVDKDTGEFDLDWNQRSVDVFLGLPFNIASYAMLMVILGELTGLTPRYLYGSLKDTHIYVDHLPAVLEQLSREITECTAKVTFPKIDSLLDLKTLTAEDFILTDYNPQPAIKAPLSVGL